MRFLMTGVVLSLAVALGCGHTRTVADTDDKEKADKKSSRDGADRAKDQQAKKRSPARDDGDATKDEKTKPKAGEAARTEAGVPLATSPSGLLKPGAERKIQEKLAADGLLKSDSRGDLDEQTRAALRRFQDSQDLPATGFPDHETIRRLGLNPDELFSGKKGDADEQPTSR